MKVFCFYGVLHLVASHALSREVNVFEKSKIFGHSSRFFKRGLATTNPAISTDTNTSVDTLIVGAGLTGLSTAYFLRKKNKSFLMIEAKNRIGGCINTVKVRLPSENNNRDFLVEAGANSFRCTKQAADLIDELGLRSKLLSADPRRPRYINTSGSLYRVPMTPFEFATSKLLSFQGKLALVRGMFRRNTLSDHGEDGDISLGDLIESRFGKEIVDKLISPFVSGVYAGNPYLLSAKSTFPLLYKALSGNGRITIPRETGAQRVVAGRTLSSFKDGMRVLIYGLADALFTQGSKNEQRNLWLGMSFIDFIQQEHDGKKVFVCTIQDQVGDRTTITANNVVLTGSASATGALLKRQENHQVQQIGKKLEKLKYAEIYLVSLAYKRKWLVHNISAFGHLTPEFEKKNMLGCIYASEVFKPFDTTRAPKDECLFTCFLQPPGEPTQKEVIAMAHEELKETVLCASTGVEEASLVYLKRWPLAVPQYELGHESFLQELEKVSMDVYGPRLVIEGNWKSGVSVGNRINAGENIAKKLLV